MKRERGWGPLCFDGRTSLYMFWDKDVFLYVFWGTCKCMGGYGEYGGIGKLELDSAYKGRGGVFATPRLHGMYRRIIKWADIFQNYFYIFL